PVQGLVLGLAGCLEVLPLVLELVALELASMVPLPPLLPPTGEPPSSLVGLGWLPPPPVLPVLDLLLLEPEQAATPIATPRERMKTVHCFDMVAPRAASGATTPHRRLYEDGGRQKCRSGF